MVYGREYARAFNEPQWGRTLARSGTGPPTDVGHAIQRAITPASHTAAGLGMEMMARQGIVARGMKALDAKAAEMRQRAKTIAAGMPPPEPLAESSAYPKQVPPEPEFVMNSATRSRGGRKVLGGINERLGDIEAREESSTAMDGVVESILTTGNGGQTTIPKLTSGRRRS